MNAVEDPNATTGGTGDVSKLSSRSKKQLFMLQRAERLKDPKVRHMGIDRQALDEQVREKEALQKMEKERNDYFDRQALLMDRHACALQQEVNDIRASREKELEDFRKTYQKKEMTREWDLNDPLSRRKDIPARVGDEDPRNGIASLQKFEGEDLDFLERKKAQQKQQVNWAKQQIDEKLAKKWMEQECNRAFDERNEEVNFRQYQVDQAIANRRKEINKNVSNFNLALADQQKEEAVRLHEEETKKGLEEIAYMMDCDFLNERESVVNPLGEKVKAERYRGLTQEQLAKLRDGQREQLQELRRRKLLEVEEGLQHDQQEILQLRMAKALDRERERERRAEKIALSEEHKVQMDAAKQNKAQLDELYTNKIDEDYYKYWDRCM